MVRLPARLRWSHLLCLISLVACNTERTVRLTPGGGGGGGGSGVGTTATDTGTADTDGLDTPGCDPLLDPVDACGPDLTCDLDTLSCVPRDGAGVVDDPCLDDGECSPGLICVDGRCRSLCDPEGEAACATGELCTVADAPIPGLCLAGCDLIAQDCAHPDDGCNRAIGPALTLVSACTANPGAGVEDSVCSVDGECSVGFLCTLTDQHAIPCSNDEPACCTAICDIFDPLCLGLEQACAALSVTDQANAGYCGIP